MISIKQNRQTPNEFTITIDTKLLSALIKLAKEILPHFNSLHAILTYIATSTPPQ